MQEYLNTYQAFQKGNFTGYKDLTYSDREVLRHKGFDLGLLDSVKLAQDDTMCDVYNFKTNTKKLRHVGLYNGIIEFDYSL